MKLVIGGCAQGKLDHVRRSCGAEAVQVWDGELPGPKEEAAGGGKLPETEGAPEGRLIVDHLHRWVRRRITEGGCPEEELLRFVDAHPDSIIICDETGNGIVPADPVERECRERTGRILVELARRAEEVERVICGIGQRIK